MSQIRRVQHLTYDKRCQIEVLLRSSFSQSAIADKIGCHRTTIYREIRRNLGGRGYRHKQAHAMASERRARASRRPTKLTAHVKEIVISMLKGVQASPEQISGRLSHEFNITLSPERIYQFIWNEKKHGGKLYTHLRRCGKKYNKRAHKNAGRGLIPGRVDISERPKIVDAKSRIGDLEVDTIIGTKHRGAILSIVDRKSKYALLEPLKNTTSSIVKEAIIRRLSGIKNVIHTLTSDNGKEFAKHKSIAQKLKIDMFFARPYCSWQRGLNEHTNGLVRQYFRKKDRLDNITQDEVMCVERRLNHRPRKSLNFRTPAEIFLQHLANTRGCAFQS